VYCIVFYYVPRHQANQVQHLKPSKSNTSHQGPAYNIHHCTTVSKSIHDTTTGHYQRPTQETIKVQLTTSSHDMLSRVLSPSRASRTAANKQDIQHYNTDDTHNTQTQRNTTSTHTHTHTHTHIITHHWFINKTVLHRLQRYV